MKIVGGQVGDSRRYKAEEVNMRCSECNATYSKTMYYPDMVTVTGAECVVECPRCGEDKLEVK